jgi:nitrate/TMAO reductase-like tetraheme cytochrome c subunit
MRILGIILLFCLSALKLNGQLSPGDLSDFHSNLDGISNCTKCHVLGNKISNDNCLNCHSEIKSRIIAQKGYHSSADVKGKLCSSCHSEHNGKKFQLVHLDITKFDHNLTGFNLSIPHSKKECIDCHSVKYISDQNIKEKKSTYLGLVPECLTCHADYHLKTLSSVCLNCHNPDSFKPAAKFNHSNSKFPLLGKHKNTDCIKCHKTEMIDGKKFQEFSGIQYANCTNCHKDPHQDKFGQNCRQCHNEESFQIVKNVGKFDHNKTNFRLEERHLTVDCKACHKTKLTDPLQHKYCTDCHADYHMAQFVKNGTSPDCSQCHTVAGFSLFSFTTEQHNLGNFPLEGSHTAIPCTECHKKQEKWSFRDIGIKCNDCHPDIHTTYIDKKYYPEENCKNCHNVNRWQEVTFDHSKTEFALTGAHLKQDCRSCHFKIDSTGTTKQKFAALLPNCTSCHKDNHFKQFDMKGSTDCIQCHNTDNWKASGFNHNNTAFRLDGKHINVDCAKCHKPVNEGNGFYIKYKLKVFTCESCHS